MVTRRVVCPNCEGEGIRPARGGVMMCATCSGRGALTTPWRPAVRYPEVVPPLKKLLEE